MTILSNLHYHDEFTGRRLQREPIGRPENRNRLGRYAPVADQAHDFAGPIANPPAWRVFLCALVCRSAARVE